MHEKLKNRTVRLPSSVDWQKAAGLFQRLPTQETKLGIGLSSKEILHFLAAAGAVGIVLAFPPALSGVAAMVKLGMRDYRCWGVRRQLVRLKKQKYVKVRELSDGRTSVTITKNGMTRALTYQLRSLTIQKLKKWDKKWRVVIFDVPEKMKHLRDRFRQGIVQFGLCQLQESIYVSPYPCFDEIEFLRELVGVSVSVRYMLAVQIEDDERIRGFFGLLDD